MQEVKRKKGETFESFVRRFNKRLMQSGVILEFKKKRYLEKSANKNLQRKNAILRKQYKEKMEFLRKSGKLPEDKTKKRRRY